MTSADDLPTAADEHESTAALADGPNVSDPFASRAVVDGPLADGPVADHAVALEVVSPAPVDAPVDEASVDELAVLDQLEADLTAVEQAISTLDQISTDGAGGEQAAAEIAAAVSIDRFGAPVPG